MSSVFLWVAMPALLTSTSRRPKVSTVFLNSAMIASSLVRSAGSGSASPPLALMPAATSSSSSARRATSTVFAPSAANSSAMPRPIPLLAPVTIAILPWSCPAILYSRSRKCPIPESAQPNPCLGMSAYSPNRTKSLQQRTFELAVELGTLFEEIWNCDPFQDAFRALHQFRELAIVIGLDTDTELHTKLARVRDDAFTERLARGIVGSKTPVDVI